VRQAGRCVLAVGSVKGSGRRGGEAVRGRTGGTEVKRPRNPVTWVDARGQVVYVKGSRKNRTERLSKSDLEAVRDLISGTVTIGNGKVFYAPFRLASEAEVEAL